MLVWLRKLGLKALRPGRLKVEVQAHLPVLPVLRGQLAETARQVEQAVVEVCGNFRSMIARTRETVAGASRLLGVAASGQGDQSAGLESLIDVSHTTILHLLERMERNSDLSLRAVRRMEEVESAAQRMGAALAEVDRIAFASKLLALNAKIQAVHVGELGNGFGVVADEISDQARRSGELTEQIGGNIRSVTTAALAAAGELRDMASADRTVLAASRREAEAALSGLRQGHQQARDYLALMAQRNTELADEISQAVVGLQFQDRVSQRLGHVMDALESMESALRGTHSGGFDEDHTRHQQVVASLRESYTMESERALLAGEAGAPGPNPSEEESDVELF